MPRLTNIITLTLCFITAVFFAPPVNAADFHTTMVVKYTINDDGIAAVEQHISLTNLTSSVYATKYALSLPSPNINRLQVESLSGKNIPFDSQLADNQMIVHISFTDLVVGQGNTQDFVLRYHNPDASQKHGNVLQLSIPPLSQPDTIDSYQVVVIVPAQFSSPSAVSPDQYRLGQDPALTVLTFDHHAASQGISAYFGDKQVYQVHLIYELANQGITPIDTQIALPPDTSYQRAFIQQLDPLPTSVKADPDGNWIATYSIEPKSTLSVSYQGHIEAYIKPTFSLPFDPASLKQYLSDQPYWDTNSPLIAQLSQTHSSAFDIFTYVTTTLSYDYSRIDTNASDRLGAVAALQDPSQSLCMEYSDSFIAIARAAGIPARLHTGYAHTDNPRLQPLSLIRDVLHAWPEYYDFDKNLWILVDPTWQDTTGGIDYFSQFDPNHLTFAIHGLSSQLPYPAGFYRDSNDQHRNIDVTVSNTNPIESYDFAIELHPAASIIGNSLGLKLNLTNLSNVAVYNTPITLKNHTLDTSATITLDHLLPYQAIILPVSLPLASGENHITIHLLDHVTNLQFTSHQPSRTVFIIALSAAMGLALTFITAKAWRLLVSRFRR